MHKFLIGAAFAGLANVAVAQAPAVPPAPPVPGAMVEHHRMMMGDRVQTRDEVVSKVREHFAMMDTNRDSVIDTNEMQSMRAMHMKRMGGKGQRMTLLGPAGDPAKAFDRLDSNRDGMISRDEFAKGREMRIERRVVRQNGQVIEDTGNQTVMGAPGTNQRRVIVKRMGGPGMRGAMHMRMLRMADLNKDGRISLQEAQTSALQHFDMMDANRDGRVTPEERRERRMQMRSQRMQKAG